MKPLEYTRFATVTIFIAQLLAGILGFIAVVLGVVAIVNGRWSGLLGLGEGIVYLGLFFALTRVLNLDDREGS